jgi:hypothetical protein
MSAIQNGLFYRSGLKKYYEMMEREVQLEKKDSSDSQETRMDTVDNNSRTRHNPTLRSNYANSNGGIANNGKSGLPAVSQNSDNRRSESSLILGEQTMSLAFLLVILTLMIITLALFKLAGAISALSERLGTIEELLERYALVCLDPNMKYHGERVVS